MGIHYIKYASPDFNNKKLDGLDSADPIRVVYINHIAAKVPQLALKVVN